MPETDGIYEPLGKWVGSFLLLLKPDLFLVVLMYLAFTRIQTELP